MASSSGDRELDDLSFWPADIRERLRAASITSAHQLAATAETDAGLDALAAQAGVDRAAMAGLVDATRAAIGLPRGAGAIDTSEYGLGARRPD